MLILQERTVLLFYIAVAYHAGLMRLLGPRTTAAPPLGLIL